MWTTKLVATEMPDPATGEPLYLQTKIRPAWYWSLCRLQLFLSIVWRVWDTYPDGSVYRLSIRTAWSVSEVAKGMIAPIDAALAGEGGNEQC